MLTTSDIPKGLAQKAPVDWELELQAAYGLPLSWNGLQLPPVTIGIMSLLEMARCIFPMRPSESSGLDIARTVFILAQGKDAHALCQSDAAQRRERELCANEISTELDERAASFVAPLPEEAFLVERLEALSKWFSVALAGYEMIHVKDAQPTQSPWLFGLDAIAAHIAAVSEASSASPDDIVWNMPMAMGSMLVAQAARKNGEVKIERPVDRAHLTRLDSYCLEVEMAGKLNFWQKADPVNFPLSSLQVVKGGEKLVLEIAALCEKVQSLSPEDQYARKMKILREEAIQ